MICSIFYFPLFSFVFVVIQVQFDDICDVECVTAFECHIVVHVVPVFIISIMSQIKLKLKLKKSKSFPLERKIIKRYKERDSYSVD